MTLYVTGIKQYCSVIYGTGIIQHVAVDLAEPFYDCGINQCSSAVITKLLCCSAINHKQILCFHVLWKVSKNYRTVSIFVMWNMLIAQENSKKYRTVFSRK